MAQLVAAMERSFGTYFAILEISQPAHQATSTPGTYAASMPGALSLMCGTKYADLQVRVERWDERPPEPESRWEDCDELPWEPIKGAGRLQASGFDPPDGEAGLDVDGLGRARAQVLARGRHRYSYGDGPEEDTETREEWLIRLWPDPQGRDLLTAAPRRLAGPHPMHHQTTPYQAALLAWRATGWHRWLGFIPAFHQIEIALYAGPTTREELPLRLQSYDPTRTYPPGSGSIRQYSWDSPVEGHAQLPPDGPAASWRPEMLERSKTAVRKQTATLAQAAGMPAVLTFGDLLDALLRLGVLVQQSAERGELIVPSPAPVPVWELPYVNEELRENLRQESIIKRGRELQADLCCAVQWAPGGQLRTTPRQLAVRWAVTTADVIDGLRALTMHRSGYDVTPAPETLNGVQDVTITPRRPRA